MTLLLLLLGLLLLRLLLVLQQPCFDCCDCALSIPGVVDQVGNGQAVRSSGNLTVTGRGMPGCLSALGSAAADGQHRTACTCLLALLIFSREAF